jgi:hypothetical protein
MEKNRIKEILRENFVTPIQEEKKEGEKKEVKKKQSNKKYEKDYASVQRKLDGTMLKQSQVMAAAGLGSADDATARSLFSKKVRKDKNDEGGQYLFSDDELASVIKVINNPTAFLNVKNS